LLVQIRLTPDGDVIAIYDSFGGSDDSDYPAFIKFDAKTGSQKMAYWYNVTSSMQYSVATLDKEENLWLTGFD
jgi:hypothetical protein